MDKYIGLSYNTETNQLIDIILFDHKTNTQYMGIYVLNQLQKRNIFTTLNIIKNNHDLVIPINDYTFNNIMDLSRIDISKYTLKSFCKEYGLEEWTI